MSAIAMGAGFRTAPTPRDVTAGMHGLTLTRRGRAVLALLALVISAAVVLVGGRAIADAPTTSQAVVEHQVVAGETLWGIAEQTVVPGASVREAVTELVRLNGLPSAEIMAGQTILVPSRA
jgi:hypothetical protein